MNKLKGKDGFMMVDALVGITIVIIGLVAVLYAFQKGTEANSFATRSDESIELSETWMNNMRACDGALVYSTSYDSEYYDLLNQAVLKLEVGQEGKSDDTLKEDYNFKYKFSGSVNNSEGVSQTLNKTITGWNKYKYNDNSGDYITTDDAGVSALLLEATSLNTGLKYLIKAEFVKSSEITDEDKFDPERRVNVSVSSLTNGYSKTRTINLHSYIYVVEI